MPIVTNILVDIVQLDAARKEVEAAVKEVADTKAGAAHELKLLRSQLSTSQSAQADAHKALDDSR